MKVKKKALIIILIIVAIISGAYLYLRFGILKSKDFNPDLSKSKSILDLRPALLAKLKQIVKDGSDGLYILDVKDIEPDITNSKIFLTGINLSIDSNQLRIKDSLKTAPDQTYKIFAKSIQVDGIQISDLIGNEKIDLKNVFIIQPEIDVFTKKKSYNKLQRQKDTLSLYEKIYKNISGFSVSKTLIKNAKINNHNLDKNVVTSYNDLTIFLDNILIDSTTKNSKDRFLFASNANITMKNYRLATADSLYYFKCDSINVNASTKKLTALNIEFIPRISKEKFIQNSKIRKDFFNIKAKKIIISNINWWELASNEKIIASEADIYNCNFEDYINKGMTPKKFDLHNFPHQKLMNLSMGIFIRKINIKSMDLMYEEYNPNSGKSGKLYFKDINGTVQNFTNLKSEIAKNNYMDFNVETKFMKSAPAKINFKFNLAKYKTGDFTVDITANSMSNDLLNPIAEPLGMFNLKSGNVKELNVKMKGNNKTSSANFSLEYDDLYIVPLKKDEDSKGGLDKKKFTGFIANLLLIKKENSAKDSDFRKYDYIIERGTYPNFFTLAWKTILMGIIKTIGAPEKLAK